MRSSAKRLELEGRRGLRKTENRKKVPKSKRKQRRETKRDCDETRRDETRRDETRRDGTRKHVSPYKIPCSYYVLCISDGDNRTPEIREVVRATDPFNYEGLAV